MDFEYGQAITSLDLLSQVATGSSAERLHSTGNVDNLQPYIPLAQGPWATWNTLTTPHINRLHPQLTHPNVQGFSIHLSSAGAQLQIRYDASFGVEDGFDSIGIVGTGYLSLYFGDDAYQVSFELWWRVLVRVGLSLMNMRYLLCE